jgi:excisionase family DNA binding protein
VMLLKTKDAAKELAVAPKTVIKLIKTGKLPGVRVGKQWRIIDTDIAIFISRRRT